MSIISHLMATAENKVTRLAFSLIGPSNTQTWRLSNKRQVTLTTDEQLSSPLLGSISVYLNISLYGL